MYMRHKVKFFTFTIITLVATLLLSHFMFIPLDSTTSAYGSFYSEIENSLDLVMVGSSTVRDGFIPMEAYHEYGITSHSIVSAPTHLEVIEIAIDEIARTQNPKVVYIDLNGLNNQSKDNADSFVKDYYSCMPEGESKKALTKKYPYLKEKTEWELFPNHNNFRQQVFWESLIYNQMLYTKGYNPEKAVQAQKIENIDKTKTLDMSFDAKTYLNEIIEKCNQYKDRITFIFGMMPRYLSSTISSFDMYQIHSPLDAMYIVRSAKSILEKAGYEYIDYWDDDYKFDEIGLDPKTDQKDAEHLNHRGAKKFTAYFSKYLMNKYFNNKKPSHSEEVKGEFDEAYKEYLEIIKPIEKALKMN